ncbi:MAG: 4Fe-4S binding protein, partial [Myxococcales bacterium]|nr:4Fe-4S binding protein [Myxococcales bacterium]
MSVLRATVFDVQRFSVHDGPGIRTTVFFKRCPLRCAWCQNPEGQRAKIELSVDTSRCEGAGRCVRACPIEAIAAGVEGPLVDFAACHLCGACAEACARGVFELVGRSV